MLGRTVLRKLKLSCSISNREVCASLQHVKNMTEQICWHHCDGIKRVAGGRRESEGCSAGLCPAGTKPGFCSRRGTTGKSIIRGAALLAWKSHEGAPGTRFIDSFRRKGFDPFEIVMALASHLVSINFSQNLLHFENHRFWVPSYPEHILSPCHASSPTF